MCWPFSPVRPRSALSGLAAACMLSLALTSPIAAQGWIEPLPGRPIPVGGWAVEKTRSEVRVTVEDRVARVELSEWFRNEGRRVAEGEYFYPLPGEAAFAGFSLWQGGDELRGEMMDRHRAREIYEEIVRRRADPALIELAGHGLLRARIFPIEPGQERRVQLRYTQLLGSTGEALHFRYAGGIAGSEPGGQRPLPLREDRRDRDEEQREDRRNGRWLEERDRAARTDFELVIEEGDSYLDPFSPTHALEHERRGGRLIVRLEEELEGELSIFLPPARAAVGLTVAVHRPEGEDGYLMLTISPGRAEPVAEPRDVTVVMDVSGSRAGEKIRQARSALHALLASLEPEDRFRLIAFSNAVRVQREDWQAAESAALDEASDWVERLDADGATNVAGALAEAFRLEPGEGRLPVVIFLTDGLPTAGEQDPERIAAAAERARGRARVFAFGVGYDVNTHLLDRLSAAARGSTDYVLPGESVERALSLLAAKIRHPVLTDVELAGFPVQLRELYPVSIPDVFAGQELVLLARYRWEGEGELAVTGRRAGRTERFAVVASFPSMSDDHAYLPRLWASRKLGHLTRQIWLEGPTPSLVEEIRQVALRYGLPSEYTAYLVTEPERILADGRRGERREAPLGLDRIAVAPSAAQGAGAVASAERAGRLRAASRTADLEAVAEELESRLGGDADKRLVAGRLFELRDGVWVEVATTPSDRLRLVTVKLFSRAWFDLVAALPEVAPAARELGRLELVGARVRVRLDEAGLEELPSDRLAKLVTDFRGVD